MSTHALPADELIARLGPLLAAEAAAETSGSGAEPGDLEQAVWLRLLERLSRGDRPQTRRSGCAARSAPSPAASAAPSAGKRR